MARTKRKSTEEVNQLQDKVKQLSKNISTEGERIIKEELPRKVYELNELLVAPAFNLPIKDILPNLSSLNIPSDNSGADSVAPSAAPSSAAATSPAAEGESNGKSDAAGAGSAPVQGTKKLKTEVEAIVAAASLASSGNNKKRRLSESSDSESSSMSGTQDVDCAVPCNKHIIDAMKIIKREVKEVVETVATLKIWIQLMIPRIEDGNNFGVGVQEDCLGELSRMEDHSFGVLESYNKYFHTRAKLASKLLKHPTVMDYKQTILECDEMEYISLRICLLDLRNGYMTMHDLLQKNLEKIRAPRSTSNRDMMML